MTRGLVATGKAGWLRSRRGAAMAVAVCLVMCCILTGCAGSREGGVSGTEMETGSVLAAESFLADIAQNVAGNRLTIQTLLPLGADPHGFEPTPGDVRKVAEAAVLIVNGAGFEAYLDDLLAGAGGDRVLVEASAGLKPRSGSGERDPHFWLDPVNVKTYVENIRRALATFDPEGADEYASNAATYTLELDQLDAWVKEQIQTIVPERRLLITNHDSFSYYADRYGLRVVGTVLPGASTGVAPSAQQMTRLITDIKEAGAPAIFLESGANSQLAKQIARDTGAVIVTGLYTHSTSDPDGRAPTYLDMIRYNTIAIAGALQ